MATHSSIFVWETPWTEEPGQGYSPWGCKRVRYNLALKQNKDNNKPWRRRVKKFLLSELVITFEFTEDERFLVWQSSERENTFAYFLN